MANSTSLGQAIKLLRSKRRVSARKLSEAIGFSPSYINKIEKGEIDPSVRAFAKIAYYLQMSPPELVYLLNSIAMEDET